MSSSLQPYMDWEANGPSYLTDVDVEDDGARAAAGEEIWHVAVAWDDIKTMTLEQLDDALRLDVVAADTPVWKEGMDGWQPLSVVAGMEEEAEAEEPHDEPEVLEDEDDEATVMRPFPFPASKRDAAPRSPNPPPRPPGRSTNPPPRSAVRAPSPPPAASRAPSPQPVTLRNASARSAEVARSAPAVPVKTQPRMKAAQPSPAAHVFAQPSRSAPPPAAHVFAQPPRSAPPPATHMFAPSRSASAPPPGMDVFAPPQRSAPPRGVSAYPAPAYPSQRFPQAYPQQFQAQPFASSRPPSPASLAPNADLGFARSMAPGKPFARPRRRRGSGAVYFFIPLALVGGLFAAYRNDLLLDAARALHQESRYLQVERALVGVPGFGTPRSVAASGLDTASEPSTDSTAIAEPSRDEPLHTAPALDTHSAPSLDTHPTAAATVAKAEPKPTEAKAAEPKPVEATRAFAETRSAPVREEPHRAAAPERPAPRSAHVASVAPVSHAAPSRAEPPPPPEPSHPSSTKHESHDVKAAKVVLSETPDEAPAPRPSKRTAAAAAASTKAAASFGSVAAHAEEEAPPPKKAAAPKPPPPPKAKPAEAPSPPPATVTSGNSFLDDAIKNAVNKKGGAPKKAAPGAAGDPLNGSLD